MARAKGRPLRHRGKRNIGLVIARLLISALSAVNKLSLTVMMESRICRSCRPASSLDQTPATPSVVVEDPEEEGVVALRDEPQSENLEFVAELDAEHLDALL